MGIKIIIVPFFIAYLINTFGFLDPKAINLNNLIVLDFLGSISSFLQGDEVVAVTEAQDVLYAEVSGSSGNNTFTDDLVRRLGLEVPDSNERKNRVNNPFSNPDSLTIDSLAMDSLAVDTVLVDSMALDSTARLRYFRYDRNDSKSVEFNPKKKSSFFVYPSPAKTKRTVELDSTGQFVLIKESVSNQETRVYLKVPLEQYIQMRLDAVSRGSWEEIGYQYELKSDKKDLSQLLTDITNIEIPLPSVSFLSIFGPQKISLRINGAVDIHGAWRNESTEGLTASRLGNTRNEPDFKQQVQINVNGTIGDKLTIGADWNTERTFEYENQLKLKYKGYDDEIIQNVEAGNVSLQTSPLVGGSEALFGIKADFKMGPLSFTALASQKKSEVEEVSVSGGSEKQTFEIHAYDYSRNHYFVDTIYASRKQELNLFNKFYGNPVPLIEDQYRIKDLEVWKTTTGIIDPSKEKRGNAFINLTPRKKLSDDTLPLYGADRRDSTLNSVPGERVIGGRFIRLTEGVDYIYNEYAGFISFVSQIQEQDAIGIAYRVEGLPDDEYYGEFIQELTSDTSSTIVLKLVKPPNLQPQFRTAWKLQLKNIYPIGGRDVKKEGFKLEIKYIIEGQEPSDNIAGIQLLQSFGLDKTDESGTSTQSDGAFDYLPEKTIFPLTGEIILPVLQPFGRDFPDNLPDSLAYLAVYDTTVTFAKQDRAKDKFIITGEYSAAVSSVFNIGFNVVENSVRVTLGGRELTEGVDYSVDYNIGQVIIRNDAALVPGAALKITYEKNDLFQLASKTLLGLRAVYDFSTKTKLGFSFLNLNQQTLSDKVRIGEEPLNNSIFGADFQTSLEMPFITDALDYVISTKEMSSLSLKGEFAYIDPDPNTKKSKIVSDESKSIAYIDDFEGSKRIIPIGITYTGWHDLSIPDNLPFIGNFPRQEQMRYKAKSYWFEVIPSNVNVRDIWGDRRKVAREDEQVRVLDYLFQPTLRGAYNYEPDLESNISQNWGGIMKILSSTANNLIEENIEFIEFWFHVDKAPEGAKFLIDLGQISEDVIPNGKLDSEDKNQNDLVDEGEDTGIDGLTDAQERVEFASQDPDPSGDNFFFNLGTGDYSRINGTEGNAALTDIGRLPDSEDLNRNFTIDRVDSYFRYEVPIDTNRMTNDLISGGGDNAGWYQFRIPLKDYVEKIGDPSFSVVEYIRLWISGVDEEVHVRFAEINLVGNQWQKVALPGIVTEEDTVLTISTINKEDNPEYTSPPGVEPERDRSQPDQEVFKNEQSLQLLVKKLQDGDSREIVKYLYRPLDIFSYGEMKLFIHGDENDLPGSVSYYEDENNFASEVYFRFGSDSLNFYEYRQPVRAGWNEISIEFANLTPIKQKSPNLDSLYSELIPGLPGHSYGVRGKPTLTRITFFTIGVLNPTNPDGVSVSILDAVSGDIWINELRVLGADDSPGWAYSASTSLRLADLLSVNFNMSQTDPNFHKLAQRFGSRVDSKNWGMSVDFDVIKVLPFNMTGSNLRVNYSHTESISKPVYLPGTDIQVDEASQQLEDQLLTEGVDAETAQKSAVSLRTDAQTINISDTWNVSNIKFKVPSNKWYWRDFLNSIVLGFNYNKTKGRNPTTLKNSSWVWNASAKYSLSFSKDYFFYPAEIPLLGSILELFEDYRNVKFYYTPQTFDAGVSASRKRSFNQSRNENALPNVQRDFTAKRNASFGWKFTEGGLINPSINYNMDISSSLAYLLTTLDGFEREENEIWRDIFGGEMFGEDFRYNQNFDFRTNPKLPALWDLNKFFTLTAGYGVTYNWQNNFQEEELGRSAGFSSNYKFGFQVRWKSLFGPMFKEEAETKGASNTQTPQSRRGRRDRNVDEEIDRNNRPPSQRGVAENPVQSDTTAIPPDTVQVVEKEPIFLKALEFLKSTVRYIFFDYDNFSFNFSQNNQVASTGLLAKYNGFRNFWGLKYNPNAGPSRLFQLGFSFDPGPRAPNGNLRDNFTQRNNVDFKTSRPLWEGAKIDLSWNLGWGINKTTSLRTDSLGNVFVNNITSTGNIDRSFLSVPFFLTNTGIKKVAELYDPESENPNKSLSAAYIEGFETFPILSKLPIFSDFAKFLPRVNWRINWTGLEKLSIFKGFAKNVSLNHAYASTYAEGWKINPDGFEETQTQKIQYGFAPLLGLNITFESMWDGNLTGSIKYATKTSYDLGISTRNITESFSKDISLSASFSKSGFEIPLFGLYLKNDVEFSFSYTSGQNSVVIFEMDNFNEEGKPQDGTTRTIIEPRMKFVMSSRVTLSLFYKNTSVQPEGASRIPPTTTNEAGLDVHISIQ